MPRHRWKPLGLNTRKGLAVGQLVRVSEGSGTSSRRLARVVDRREVRTDGRGIPTNVEGAYSPVDWRKETAIRFLDDRRLDTMWNERLRPVFASCCRCRCGCERGQDHKGEEMCTLCRSGACG